VNSYDFHERLAFSRDRARSTDADTIQALIPGCVSVAEAPLARDLRGIDYVATLRRGAELFVDIKAREKGCSAFWKSPFPLLGECAREPELALEIYSVEPSPAVPSGKVGWTLDESKLTHYTLHVFDLTDTNEVFLLPFQLLRAAFLRRFHDWTSLYRVASQNSGRWTSRCVFVPAMTVIDAIQSEMRCAC